MLKQIVGKATLVADPSNAAQELKIDSENRGFHKARRASLKLKCLDPCSGRKILAIWHGTGAYHGVFNPRNLVLTNNGIVRPAIVILL